MGGERRCDTRDAPIAHAGPEFFQLLQAVVDLIRPEPLEADQGAVEAGDVARIDFADGLERAELALIELVQHVAGCLALVGQAHPHAAPVGFRALVVDVAHVDELLQVVGDVRAEVVAARLQFTRSQLAVADVVEQKRLDGVQVGATLAVELVLDDVEQEAVKPLDEAEGLKVLTAEIVPRDLCGLLGRRRRARSNATLIVLACL